MILVIEALRGITAGKREKRQGEDKNTGLIRSKESIYSKAMCSNTGIRKALLIQKDKWEKKPGTNAQAC